MGLLATAWSVVPDLTTRAALLLPLILLPAIWWTLRQPERWVLLFLVAALCLPPLPIALGGSGPHPALAAASIGLLAGLLEWRLRKERVPAASLWLIVYVLVLLGSVSFAVLYSGAELAAASLARVALLGISVYLFFYTACGPAESGRELRRSLRILFAAGVVSAAFACLAFFLQLPAPAGFAPQFVWMESGVYRRAQGFFYEASTLGNVCAFFLVMVAVCWLRPRHEAPLSRTALAAGGAVLLGALMLSFSRAAVVNLAVAGLVLVFLNRRRLPVLRLGVIGAVALAAGVAAYFLIPAMAEFYWIRLEYTLQSLLGGDEAALSGRLDTWRFLLDFLRRQPEHLLFGVGYKTLPYSDFLGRAAVADNGYLSSLVETGLVGLASLLLFHGAILAMAWRAARSEDRQAQLLGTWMLCFWAGEMVQMLSGDLLTYWRVVPAYLWVLALAVRHARRPAAM